MYQLIVMLKAVNEVALLALLAQGILYLFTGVNRDSNAVYFIFKTITRPVFRLTRAITPRIVLDRHLGFVVFLLLAVIEAALIAAKIFLFLEAGGRA